MFVFLPISMFFYALLGKNKRRYALAVIAFFFYVLMNASSPWNLIYFAALGVYSYLCGRLIVKKRRAWLCALMCLLPYVVLFSARIVSYFNLIESFVYPVGFTVSVLFSTSYLITQYRSKQGFVGNIIDLALYISFFPILIVGPIIRFSDFSYIVRAENIKFNMSNAASGVRLFAIGVIKRMAVGAALFDMYYSLFALFSDSPNFMVLIFMLISVYFAAFFTVAGYLDIGVGLARMYGLPIETYTVADPFNASTVTTYFGNLFNGLLLWTDDYLVSPLLERVGEGRPRRAAFVRAACCGTVFILFIRSSPAALLLIIPSVIFFYIAYRTRLDDRLAARSGLRALMTFLTMIAVASIWVFVTLGEPLEMVQTLEEVAPDNPEYRMDQILAAFSWIKYFFVMLIAGVITWTSIVEAYMRAPELSKQKVYPAAQYISFVSVILLFFFTVIFFVPQYSIYDTTPFLNLYI